MGYPLEFSTFISHHAKVESFFRIHLGLLVENVALTTLVFSFLKFHCHDKNAFFKIINTSGNERSSESPLLTEDINGFTGNQKVTEKW